MKNRKIKAAIKHLRQAAELLAECDYTMSNGGLADSLVGSVADELETVLELKGKQHGR